MNDRTRVSISRIVVVSSACLVSAATAATARARETFEARAAVVAEAYTPDGITFTAVNQPQNAEALRYNVIPAEYRFLIGIPIDAIPDHATVVEAFLHYRVVGASVSPSNLVNFYGHAGDGALTGSDATDTADLLGTWHAQTLGTFQSSLDAGVVQDIVAAPAPFLEVVGAQMTRGQQMVIAATNGFYGPGATPLLHVTYTVPEPGTAMSLLGLVPVAIRLRRPGRRACVRA